MFTKRSVDATNELESRMCAYMHCQTWDAMMVRARRAMTAAVCRAWAAVHADDRSGIWEAADMNCVISCVLDRGFKDAKVGYLGVALCPWLARRAPGLQQLDVVDCLCDTNCIKSPGVTAEVRFC